MRLADASTRFEEVLRAGPGVKLYGQVVNLNQGSTTFDFPVRQLLVNANSLARAGMEVVTTGGFRYLLAENLDDLQAGVVSRSFIMIRLDRVDMHTRYGKTVDPVTGLDRGSSPIGQPQQVWYQARSLRLSEGVLNIPEARYSIITGADIAEGDTLGDLRILHVENRLGVKFAEAR